MLSYDKPKRHVGRVFLHCSASDDPALSGEALVRAVRKWHTAQGFRDIGYHYLIDHKGAVMTGRPTKSIPAAQKGNNTGSIAIMVHGLETFTTRSLRSLQRLCRQINRAHEGRVSFHGHCEVANKECPVYDYRHLLALDTWQRML